jgi:hypothetical protein
MGRASLLGLRRLALLPPALLDTFGAKQLELRDEEPCLKEY